MPSVDSEYLRGVGKQDNRLVILLDLDKVLTTTEARALERMENNTKRAAERAAA